MKVREVSLLLNRSIDANVNAIIIPTEDDDVVDINIHFHSFKAYRSFIKSPVLSTKNFDMFDAEVFTEGNLNEIVSSKDFKNRIQASKLNCRISKSPKYNEALFKQPFPLTINIRGIPFTQKLDLMTNPLANDSIYFLDDYTENEEVSLREISDMYQCILNIAKKINDMNYSQLESIYYIYDILKNRIYNEEQTGENKNKSRGLNHVINGDNIVCSGYTNYFLAVSDVLGLNVERIIWDPTEGHKNGHASLIAYINDSKYQVHGIWGIDPTWDSKRNKDDNNYHNNLSHFLVPISYDEKEKSLCLLENPHGNHYYSIFSALRRYRELLNFPIPEVLIKNAKALLLKRINKIYELIGLKQINFEAFDPEIEVKKINLLEHNGFPLFKLEKVIATVTPKSLEEIEAAIETTSSYKCMNNDDKSIYRLVRALKLN